MDYLGVASFFAVTLGHCALMPWWVRRASGPLQSAEELLFISAVVTLGSLQAVLHVLACTLGISLPAGVAALVALHVAIAAWMRRDAGRHELPPLANGEQGGSAQRRTNSPPSSVKGASAVSANDRSASGRKKREPNSGQESTRTRRRAVEPAAQSWAALAVRVPWLSVSASAVVVTIVLSWLYRAADSTTMSHT
jgi:hypothetical protein